MVFHGHFSITSHHFTKDASTSLRPHGQRLSFALLQGCRGHVEDGHLSKSRVEQKRIPTRTATASSELSHRISSCHSLDWAKMRQVGSGLVVLARYTISSKIESSLQRRLQYTVISLPRPTRDIGTPQALGPAAKTGFSVVNKKSQDTAQPKFASSEKLSTLFQG